MREMLPNIRNRRNGLDKWHLSQTAGSPVRLGVAIGHIPEAQSGGNIAYVKMAILFGNIPDYRLD